MNKRKKASILINCVIMTLTATLVISLGIYFGGQWIQMLAQREEARMEAKNNSGSFSNTVRGIAQIVIGCIILYAVFKGLKYKKAKEEKYDEKVVKRAVGEVLPNAEFIRNGCIEVKKLYEYGIIPVFNDYKKEGMLRYQKGINEYCFSNIHLLSRQEDKDERVYYNTIYKGQVYTANYETWVPGTIRIFATKRMPVIKKKINAGYASKRSGETKIETAHIQFNDNFNVYATSEQSASLVLSHYVMEQLLEMKRSYEQIGVYISGNLVIIALKTNRIMLPKRIYNNQKEAEALEEVKIEVREMLKMAAFLENVINGRREVS